MTKCKLIQIDTLRERERERVIFLIKSLQLYIYVSIANSLIRHNFLLDFKRDFFETKKKEVNYFFFHSQSIKNSFFLSF
jgi:hypothetical protein